MNVALTLLPGGLDLISIGARDAQGACWPSLLSGISGRHVDIAGDVRTRSERNILAARLDRAVAQGDRPVLLVAEGESCFAAIWWARLSPAIYVSRIAGALFVDPIDGDDARRRFASPRIALPFPSLLIDSRADDRKGLAALTRDWGSRLVGRGPATDEAGAARAWCYAQRMVTRFTVGIVERDVFKAEKLSGGR